MSSGADRCDCECSVCAIAKRAVCGCSTKGVTVAVSALPHKQAPEGMTWDAAAGKYVPCDDSACTKTQPKMVETGHFAEMKYAGDLVAKDKVAFSPMVVKRGTLSGVPDEDPTPGPLEPTKPAMLPRGYFSAADKANKIFQAAEAVKQEAVQKKANAVFGHLTANATAAP